MFALEKMEILNPPIQYDGNSLEFIANQLHYSSVLSIMEIYCNFLEKDETHENSRLDSVVFSANDSI